MTRTAQVDELQIRQRHLLLHGGKQLVGIADAEMRFAPVSDFGFADMQIGKPGNIGFPDSASLQNRNHALEINARFLIHMTEKFPQIVIHKQHRHIFGNNRQSREETAFFPQTAPKSVFLPQNRVFDISFLAKSESSCRKRIRFSSHTKLKLPFFSASFAQRIVG